MTWGILFNNNNFMGRPQYCGHNNLFDMIMNSLFIPQTPQPQVQYHNYNFTSPSIYTQQENPYAQMNPFAQANLYAKANPDAALYTAANPGSATFQNLIKSDYFQELLKSDFTYNPYTIYSLNNQKPKNADASQNYTKLSKNKRIELLKNYLKLAEGGYAEVKYDRGGATKYGVTHDTYDYYREKIKHLPKRSVKEMTDDEYSEIIDWFWEKSGADKVENPILAFYVFATDWGSGLGKGQKFLKECGGSPEKFEELRRNFYNRIAVGTQIKFKKGWQNRVTKDHNFAYSKLVKNNTDFIA